ncbi:hypothetical protein [Streptomyces axinellae]|uniref:PRC-barrel domain-containing protein n=1 Tax=Streptomyces axinellae TaxID=552788 RepID=A0ABP6CPF7_9ACTN
MTDVAALQRWRGAMVRDEETGLVGILMDVVVDYVDPQQPRGTCAGSARKGAVTVFIRPQGGGLEYAAAPEAVRLVEPPGARGASPGCPHPVTALRNGRTHCGACGVQLYL